jgi:hypothetical protein
VLVTVPGVATLGLALVSSATKSRDPIDRQRSKRYTPGITNINSEADLSPDVAVNTTQRWMINGVHGVVV